MKHSEDKTLIKWVSHAIEQNAYTNYDNKNWILGSLICEFQEVLKKITSTKRDIETKERLDDFLKSNLHLEKEKKYEEIAKVRERYFDEYLQNPEFHKSIKESNKDIKEYINIDVIKSFIFKKYGIKKGMIVGEILNAK